MSDVELIVLDLDGNETLAQCLDSIAAQSERPRRVIVFDNGSAIPVRDRLPERSDGLAVTIMRHERNAGFTGGINRAMVELTASYVGWVNNDVVLDREWLRTLRQALDEDVTLGAVQPIIRGPDLVDGAGIVVVRGQYRQLGHGLLLEAVDVRQAWGVSGTAAMFRAQALREAAIQGFVLHPAFFAYYEDVELSARLHEHHWTTLTVNRDLALHRGSATAARLGALSGRLRVRNRYFVNRLHSEVGNRWSLLAEDARRIAVALASGQIRSVWETARAVLEGLTAPIVVRQ